MIAKLRQLSFVLLICSSFSIGSADAQHPIDSTLLKYLKNVSEQYANYPDSAIAIFKTLLNTPQYAKDIEKKSAILISLGREYVYRKHEYALALQYFNHSLAFARSAKNCHLELRAIIHTNLVYYELGDMATFLNNYQKAEQILETCSNFVDAYYIYTQLGLYHQDGKNYTKAAYYFNKTDSAVSGTPNLSSDRIIFAYSSIIQFYKQLNNHKLASFYAQKAIKRQVGTEKDKVINYVFLSNFYGSLGELDSAIHYGTRLAQLEYQKHDVSYDDFIYIAIKNTAKYYARKGDFQNAFLYQTRYTKYLDSLATVNKNIKINQQIDLLKHQLDNTQKEQKLERNKWLLLLAFTLLLVATVVGYLIYRYNQKLKHLNHQLAYQKQALALQNNIRTKMFMVLSHDLVSPIAALQNMVGLFQKGILNIADVKTYSSDMKQHLDALLTTIKSVLDWSLSQFKGEKPVIKSLELKYIIDTQFNLHNSLAHQKSIQLINNVPKGFTILADLHHINLITRNIIDNAIKYTGNNGKITVNAFDTEGGKILEISDTGIGMAEENIQAVLNLHQYSATNPLMEVGLGLKMVQDLLSTDGNELSIKSKKGVGSTFSIYFKS